MSVQRRVEDPLGGRGLPIHSSPSFTGSYQTVKIRVVTIERSGPLVPADETLTHQIVDTFGSVAQSDPSWTEKVWAIAHARDGSLQVVFGVGKYTNRGVFDGAGGVARGTDQWTVRGSRRLAADPGGMSVGPWHYEIVEPLQSVRGVLERTEHAAISFDVTWHGECPVSLEVPWPDRSGDGYRITHDVLRYHQVGVATGWVEVDGERTAIDPEGWVSFRDHSWGSAPGSVFRSRSAPDAPGTADDAHVVPDAARATRRLTVRAVRLLRPPGR